MRFVLFFLLLPLFSAAQKLPAPDKSPMDMAYYPANYPVLKIQDKVNEPLMARVIFSRPQKAGRTIFGELIEYGKVWRLGANEATEIEFFQNASFGDSKVKKGRYTMYAIPEKDNWTIILNKETDTWGSFNYDQKKDVARITVPVIQRNEPMESFVMAFERPEKQLFLFIAWDDVEVKVPISL